MMMIVTQWILETTMRPSTTMNALPGITRDGHRVVLALARLVSTDTHSLVEEKSRPTAGHFCFIIQGRIQEFLKRGMCNYFFPFLKFSFKDLNFIKNSF